MLALQPSLEVDSTQGVFSSLLDTTTFSTLSPSTPFIHAVSPLNSPASASSFFLAASLSSPSESSCRSSLLTSISVLPSKPLRRLEMATSSMGSTRKRTS